MSIAMLLNILIENKRMLIEAILGNIGNCIAVYTLFGKRKYDWFFPAACGVRYIFYNIGLLSVWNVMYGTQIWYKVTMSTFATLTAVGISVITAFLWKESLTKVMTGIFAAECINDIILYQAMQMKCSLLQECLTLILVFAILYVILCPVLKKYRTYIIRHKVICLTILFTFFIGGWMSNFLYDTVASLRQKPMYVLGTSLGVGGTSALILAFAIYTRDVFQKKKELEQNKQQMDNYYRKVQQEIKELGDFKATLEGTLDHLTDVSSSLPQKEKKKRVQAYIDSLKTRYKNLNQFFFCEDYLTDGILTDFAAFCKHQGIHADILFQNYHRGNIKSGDSIAILLKLIEYAKQADRVTLHATVIKNQLIYSMELQNGEIPEGRTLQEERKVIPENEINISKRAFKKYIKKYDGGMNIEKNEGKIRMILGLRRM